MPLSEHVVADYQTTRLSLKAHPLHFLRDDLRQRGFTANADLRTRNFRAHVQVAGVVLIRQRPGSAKGVCFITLEDETGVVNLVIWPDMMERYRKVVMGARLMEVTGRLEMDDEVLHVIVAKMTDASDRLTMLSDDLLSPQISRADEVNRPLRTMSGVKQQIAGPAPARHGDHQQGRMAESHVRSGHPRNARIIPKSRDFH